MARNDQMKFGFVLHGVGTNWSDWRHPDVKIDASTDFAFYKYQAQLAEAGKVDFLFVSDSISISEKSSPHDLNRFEPLTLMSALAAVTEYVGLVGTVTVSYTEPFNIARQFASLDLISGGRAGWNVVTSWLDGTAENFGQSALPPPRRPLQDRRRISRCRPGTMGFLGSGRHHRRQGRRQVHQSRPPAHPQPPG